MRLFFPVLLDPKKPGRRGLWRRRDSPRSSSFDERGKIIYGDVSLDASVEFVLAQKLGLIDEAAAGA
jgi:hypothetical protein